MDYYQRIEKAIIGKTQWVRLFDVFILAPSMMYAGATSKRLPKYLKALIFLSGVGTGVYNTWNFFRQAEINKKYGKGPLESLTELNAAGNLEGGPLPLKYKDSK